MTDNPEVFQNLIELAQQAQKPTAQIVQIPGVKEPLVIYPDGNYERVEADAPEFRFDVCSIADIETLLREMPTVFANPIVHVSTEGITLVGEREDHGGAIAHLEFEFDSVFFALGATSAMSTRGFIRHLRSDLIDYIPDGANLLAIAREMTFSSTAATKTVDAVSKANYGRSLQAEAMSEHGSLDRWDSFTVEVPILVDRNFRRKYPIRCYLDIDHGAQTLNICAYEHAKDNAIQELLVDLVEYLPTVFEGVPVITVPA